MDVDIQMMPALPLFPSSWTDTPTNYYTHKKRQQIGPEEEVQREFEGKSQKRSRTSYFLDTTTTHNISSDTSRADVPQIPSTAIVLYDPEFRESIKPDVVLREAARKEREKEIQKLDDKRMIDSMSLERLRRAQERDVRPHSLFTSDFTVGMEVDD